jgi:hypothetical protein
MDMKYAAEVVGGAALLLGGGVMLSHRIWKSPLDVRADLVPSRGQYRATPEEIEDQARESRGLGRYIWPWAWVSEPTKNMMRVRARNYLESTRQNPYANWEHR